MHIAEAAALSWTVVEVAVASSSVVVHIAEAVASSSAVVHIAEAAASSWTAAEVVAASSLVVAHVVVVEVERTVGVAHLGAKRV